VNIPRLCAPCLALLVLACPALAQQPAGYPAKPVRIIAPYGPGGAVDALSRVIALALSHKTGKSFFVENRAGAGGNIGLAALAKSPADGYTLGMGAANMLATNRALYTSLPFDTLKDFDPVGYIGSVSFVLVVHPSLPAKNLKELMALLKQKPSAYSFGSQGVGNTAHLFGEMLNKRAGSHMVHVPYKGGAQAIQELLGGRVQVLFSTLLDITPHIEQGSVRAIAIAAPTRAPTLPGVPTFGEEGVAGFDAPTWFGLIAPAGTPADIVAFLNGEMKNAFAAPEVRGRLEKLGLQPGTMTPAQFRAFTVSEVAKWARIVKESGTHME
jgi:tripartite-type tricarboxylate transporter receptor subunit TctC